MMTLMSRRIGASFTILPEVEKSVRAFATERGSNFSATVEGLCVLWLYQNHKQVPEAALERARKVFVSIPSFEITRAA
jgi:hypothetical protein